MDLVIVGWHLPAYPEPCSRCNSKADYVVVAEDDFYAGSSADICKSCLARHNVVSDKIAEVFNRLFEGKEE